MDTSAADDLLCADMDEWLWPESCGELRQIESSLRCLICGDFYHGPVVLPCTHTFCSECVRRFLQSRGANGCCPECKQPCAPQDLVANRSLEKIGVLFQQMKPKVLPLLTNAKPTRHKKNGQDESVVLSKRRGGGGAGGGGGGGADGKPAERMPLLSYSVMKEKDIKKLLESINIRASIKIRDDIVQIHKEYVLLANAQADSSHPKPAKQIREEVMRNFRARQQEKQFGLGSSSSSNSSSSGTGSTNGGRKSLDNAAAGAPVSAEMVAGFERLRQQVKNRNQNKTTQGGDEENKETEEENDEAEEEEEEEEQNGDASDGVWRHVHALKTDQSFYIHSTTNEIRLEPPREFLARQERKRLQQQQQQQAAVEDSPTPTPHVTTIASDDDDDDFEIITSPPPKPPLASRSNSTPQSLSASAKKAAKTKQRRTSSPVRSADSSNTLSSSSASNDYKDGDDATQTPTQLLTPTQPQSQSQSPFAGDNKWECPRCTLVNEGPDLTECEACGHQHRPVRKKQKLQFQRKIFASLSQDTTTTSSTNSVLR